MRRNCLVIALAAAIVSVIPVRAYSQDVALLTPRDTQPVSQTVDTTSATVVRDVTHPTVSTPPSRDGLRAGVRAPVTTLGVGPSIARNGAGLGQARAMMIVGGAAVILGAIIGDTPGTLFMVGGTVVGLIGLYEYLQ